MTDNSAYMLWKKSSVVTSSHLMLILQTTWLRKLKNSLSLASNRHKKQRNIQRQPMKESLTPIASQLSVLLLFSGQNLRSTIRLQERKTSSVINSGLFMTKEDLLWPVPSFHPNLKLNFNYQTTKTTM